MEDIKVVFETGNDKAAGYVRERLGLFNASRTGRSDYYPCNIFLRGEKGDVLGGLLGELWANWLFVAILWVDEPLRGRGYATRLMDAAEDYARRRGYGHAYLDTHSWQARPFYEKRGYELFATLDEFPPGHQKFFLKKKL